MATWVRFPVCAGSGHTKDLKNGSGPCLHGTYDEVGTTKHNWPARCQYNVTWVWAYDVLTLTHSQVLEMSREGGGGHKAIVVSKIRNKFNGLHQIYG